MAAASARGRFGRRATVVLALLVAAIAQSWPTAAHLLDAVPRGVQLEDTVALFGVWNLWWPGAALSGAGSLWNAPIFHPAPGALALSEPTLLAGLLTAPLWWAGLPAAAIYDLALIAVLFGNGLFGMRLCRALGAPSWAALCGGLMMVTLPYVTLHLGALQVLGLFGVLWSLEGLVRFGADGAWRWAWWAGAGLLVQMLLSIQLALMSVPFIVLAAATAWWHRGISREAALRLVVAGLACSLCMGLLAAWFVAARGGQDFTRSEEVVARLSASPAGFLYRPRNAALGVPPPSPPQLGDAAGLFPGLALVTLAALGAAGAMTSPSRRTWCLFLLVSLVGAALLAMGPTLALGPLRPFVALRDVVPWLGELRSPFRWVFLTHALLVPLAAWSLAEMAPASRGRAWLAVAAVGALAAAENLAAPSAMATVPATEAPWIRWLREMPDDPVILHLPMPGGFHVSEYEIEARRMIAQTAHGRRMLNGYSSAFPDAYTRLQVTLTDEGPAAGMPCVLSDLFGVDLLVVDRAWESGTGAALAGDPGLSAQLQPAFQDAEISVYRLAPDPRRCRGN